MQFITHAAGGSDGPIARRTLNLPAEHTFVAEPRNARHGHAAGELLPRRGATRLVEQAGPNLGPHFAADGLRPPFVQRTRGTKARLKVPVLIPATGVDRGPGEGIVVVTDGPAAVVRVARVVQACGIARDEFGFLERGFVGVHHLALNGLGGEPVGVGMIVPFAPGAQQPQPDEAQARVAVVTLTQSVDEVG
jgi:hypothetical protein